MVRYLHCCPLWGQLIVVFMVAALLTLTRTTIRPLFSAGLLPVMLQTHSWVIRLHGAGHHSQPSLPRGLMERWQCWNRLHRLLLCHGARQQRGKGGLLVGGVASFIMVLLFKAGWCYCLLPPLIVLCGILQFRLRFPSTAFSTPSKATLVATTRLPAANAIRPPISMVTTTCCWGHWVCCYCSPIFHRSGRFCTCCAHHSAAVTAAISILPSCCH